MTEQHLKRAMMQVLLFWSNQSKTLQQDERF